MSHENKGIKHNIPEHLFNQLKEGAVLTPGEIYGAMKMYEIMKKDLEVFQDTAFRWQNAAIEIDAKLSEAKKLSKEFDTFVLQQQLFDDIYGPKHCHHCNSVQPIQVFIKHGTQKWSNDGMIYTYSFDGNKICTRCWKSIMEVKND